jgi:(1->4)-alpha-D-glucan 1-alpha-D-glucosylmutase
VRNWPHEMLATSTHDTKRSEDVRARISVLSEMTQLWRKTIDRWSRTNRMRKREVEGELAPSRNDEAFLYQTLVGSWPLGELDEVALAAYRERIEAYMIKAVREAKIRTSWANVNADYEDALTVFIRAALDRRDGNLFLSDVMAFQRRVSRFGLLNAMSQTICKLTAPGVPDIYQGNEIWDFSLVDPDNRRPVDYERRGRLLREISARLQDPRATIPVLRELLGNLTDGRAKLYVIWRALQTRSRAQTLYDRGAYMGLRVRGPRSPSILAFLRRHDGSASITIAPRLYARLLRDEAALPLGREVWADTSIELPRGARTSMLMNVLDGAEVPIREIDGRRTLAAAEVLANFPVALLVTP